MGYNFLTHGAQEGIFRLALESVGHFFPQRETLLNADWARKRCRDSFVKNKHPV
jgi:hypothetical protein